jgi:hypothetical protein
MSPLASSQKASKKVATVIVYGFDDAGTTPSIGVPLDLPAGNYRVDYVRGSYLDCAGGCWRADVSCTFSGGTLDLPLGNGQPLTGTGFPTAADCQAAFEGSSVSATHGGGVA